MANKTIFYCAVILATLYITTIAGEETEGQGESLNQYPGLLGCNFTEEVLREHCPGFVSTTGTPGLGRKWSVGLTFNHGG